MTTTETPLHLRQAEGLRQLADMIEQHPEVAAVLPNLSFGKHFFADDQPRERLAAFASVAAKYTRSPVVKTYHGEYAHVVAKFGPVEIDLQTDREQVCERVQVGTETVTREERDPAAVEAALAPVPVATVTEEVPVYAWECRPLLAAEVTR